MSIEERKASSAPLSRPSHKPPMMNRWLAILYILFCFELGIILFMLPWVPVWNRNFFVGRFAWVSVVALNDFVRGAISGLGLADVALAFQEIWRLRRSLGLVHVRAATDGKQ